MRKGERKRETKRKAKRVLDREREREKIKKERASVSRLSPLLFLFREGKGRRGFYPTSLLSLSLLKKRRRPTLPLLRSTIGTVGL
ncbi:hypothetical protein, partial [Porphyromonas gulae]|uniref:hypothetical protein n=1 Tax=Porphyromonas gulae TaxID=111105 RepID=UPI001E2B8626